MADFTHTIIDLNHAARQLERGIVREDLAADLDRAAQTIREELGAKSDLDAVIAAYNTARAAERQAADDLGRAFQPLVHACTTAEEALDLLAKMPDSVQKAFAMDHFRYVSKVLPSPGENFDLVRALSKS